ncbi:MAG: hypothetical protein NC250_00505 [Alistipes senegalensis]|nr:hypothetical protein [Bacteroides cellulosilyticus]MCM1351201.1 hypothetical protein [Alistipes senegalensis]
MTSRQLIAAEADNFDRVVLYREGLFWKAYERSAYVLCTQVRAFKPTRKILKTLAGGDIVSVGFPAIAADRILAGLERLDISDAAGTAAAASSDSCISDAQAVSLSAVDEGVASADPAASAAGASAVPHASSATRMVFAAPRPIVESDFRAWKSALPISITIPRPAAAGTSCETSAEISAGSFAEDPAPADRAVSVVEVSRPHWWTRLGRWFTRSVRETADANVDSGGPVAGSAEQCLDALRKFEVADKTPMECMMFIAELKKQLLKI